MGKSENSIAQQVIDFTAAYTATPPPEITPATTLASIGIVTPQDTVEYMMELEDNFKLTYEQGDADGISTVDDAINLIQKKENL